MIKKIIHILLILATVNQTMLADPLAAFESYAHGMVKLPIPTGSTTIKSIVYKQGREIFIIGGGDSGNQMLIYSVKYLKLRGIKVLEETPSELSKELK